MKIIQSDIGTNSNFSEFPKRTYLEGVKIQDCCPFCNTDWEKDLSKDPLVYVRSDTPITITGYCPSCENEWSVGQIVLTAKVIVSIWE